MLLILSNRRSDSESAIKFKTELCKTNKSTIYIKCRAIKINMCACKNTY